MKVHFFKLTIVFVFCFFVIEPCSAKEINFESCSDSFDPPRCFVEAAHHLTHTKPEYDYKSILVLGAVDWIKPKHGKLLKNVRGSFEEADNFLKSLGIEFVEADQKKGIKRSVTDNILTAAVSLAAAAQNSRNPFEDSVVQRYLEKAHNDYAVSVLALNLWSDFDTYGIWVDLETLPIGLKSVLEKVIDAPQLDAKELSSLIWKWNAIQNFESVTYQKMDFFISTSNNQQKADLASRLARMYFQVKDPERLMTAGGDRAENYSIDDIYLEIAIARLHEKYDATAADLLLKHALGNEEIKTASYKNRIENIPEALEHGSATNELRALANGYLAAAENTSLKAEQRGDLYALASECFLRIKNKDSAIAAATKGLSQIPTAVKWRAPRIKNPEIATPEELSRSAHGWGTDPVVALYRAGAIKEAVATGYLNGYARYRYAKEAGEVPDPLWLIDYSWHSPSEAESIDRNFLYMSIGERKLLFDAAGKWLEAHQWAWSNTDVQSNLAQLAASIHNNDAMKIHLKAYAKILDTYVDKSDAAFFAFELAEQWKRDVRIIESLKN